MCGNIQIRAQDPSFLCLHNIQSSFLIFIIHHLHSSSSQEEFSRARAWFQVPVHMVRQGRDTGYRAQLRESRQHQEAQGYNRRLKVKHKVKKKRIVFLNSGTKQSLTMNVLRDLIGTYILILSKVLHPGSVASLCCRLMPELNGVASFPLI